MEEFSHIPVLLKELVDLAFTGKDGIYVDMTLGGGGHSEEILRRLSGGRLIAIDQDQNAISACEKRLAGYGDKLLLVHDNFSNIKNIVQNKGYSQVTGIIGDLGVSSYQLDNGERGFSFHQDAPLDMRMDERQAFCAYDVVNTYTAQKLTDILYRYGEEKWAKRIAEFIVSEREAKPIATTGELVSVIKKAVPKGARQDGPHPARRTFQAIRIEVNNELGVLEEAICDAFDLLASGGRLAIITFHSLEDRLVKQKFASFSSGCTCPKSFPVCVCGKTPRGKLLTRKGVLPSETEILQNPRARSAKVRGIEKL